MERILVRQENFRETRNERGVVRADLSKVSALSLPQTTHLIWQYCQSGHIQAQAHW